MREWNKFHAIVRDIRKRKPLHSPPVFPVHVWGVTEQTAREKLEYEYPSSCYEVESFRLVGPSDK
jgi:hypothetical protein